MFLSYSYKDFQLRAQKLDPHTMIDFYAEAAEKDAFQYQEEDGLISMKAMPSFSKAMGFPVALLRNFIHRDRAGYERLLENFFAGPVAWDCVVAKTPVDNSAALNALLKCGFYYVCGESVFTLDLSRIAPIECEREGLARIREAGQEDAARIHELSRLSHQDIRYYFDPHFDKTKVEKYFSKLAAEAMGNKDKRIFLYEESGKVQGTITLIFNRSLSELAGRGYGSLDYIAIDPKVQKKNIGFALNNHALSYFKENEVEIVSVKTMASNYPAIKLLTKNGFYVTSQNLIFHFFKH